MPPYEPPRPHTAVHGFTLVEMLVAVSVFIVVVLIAVGSLLTLLDANLKNRSQQLVFNNLNVVLEGMVRSIRAGTAYSIEAGGTRLRFNDADGDEIVYEHVVDSGTGKGSVVRTVNPSSGGAPVALTPTSLDVAVLLFEAVPFSGNASGEFDKVLITLRARSVTGDPVTDSEFTLQTTVSQNARVTVPATSGFALGTNVPYCTIPENVPGISLLVEFENEKNAYTALNDSVYGIYYLDYTLDKPIPAGDYQLYLAAWDDHCAVQDSAGNTSVCYEGLARYTQAGESITARLTLRDSGGGTRYVYTSATPDLPCGEDFPEIPPTVPKDLDLNDDGKYSWYEYVVAAEGDDHAANQGVNNPYFSCLNFFTDPNDLAAGTLDTTATDEEIIAVRILHSNCVEVDKGNQTNCSGASGGSVVPACLGFVCLSGNCPQGSGGDLELPREEL